MNSAPHVAAKNFRTKELTRVLIVEDHPFVVAGFRALFADNAEIVIIEAADAESGLASFVTEPPDVCLIDIDLPGVSGFELARRILRLNAAARIVVFGLNDDLIFAARAIEVGAKGYIPKSGDPNDLIIAIRVVKRWRLSAALDCPKPRIRRTNVSCEPARYSSSPIRFGLGTHVRNASNPDLGPRPTYVRSAPD